VERLYQVIADAVLVLHFGIVLFVVGGLAVILLGNRLQWRRVNVPWFRLTHLCAIAFVVAESWLGITCPLTTLESWLRKLAGTESYETSFVEHWVQRVLFYQAPTWVFTLLYTVFGVLVLASWVRFPPRLRIKDDKLREFA